MGNLFWSIDNLSMSQAKYIKVVGILSDPPCWDSGPNTSVFLISLP